MAKRNIAGLPDRLLASLALSLRLGVQRECDHHAWRSFDDAPISSMMRYAYDVGPLPEISRNSSAPTPAEGSVERIVTVDVALESTPITMYR